VDIAMPSTFDVAVFLNWEIEERRTLR
jgi:hypothetical protein